MKKFVPLLPLAACLILACGAGDDVASDAEFATEYPEHHLSVTRDYRRCVSPMCGGYWVAPANGDTMMCVDGTMAEKCYVASIDWDALGVSAEQLNELDKKTSLVVHGHLADELYDSFGNLGKLVADQAWAGLADVEPAGALYSVADRGIACFRFPCPDTAAILLNTETVENLTSVNWESLGLDDDVSREAFAALLDGTLVVAGEIKETSHPQFGGVFRTLFASQVYMPVVAVEPVECEADNDCVHSPFTSTIEVPEDCHCLGCGGPVSVEQDEKNKEGWLGLCADEFNGPRCPLLRCAAPPPVACVDNKCVFDTGP